MPTFRQVLADWIFADEKKAIQQSFDKIREAAQVGPFRLPPEVLIEQLREYGSFWIGDLVNRAGYRILGGLPYGSNLETLRTYAVETSRYLWITNPLYQWAVEVWANYGLGDGVTVVCKDPNANEFWQTCFKGEDNSRFFANDKVVEHGEDLEIEGNVFVIQFISVMDGTSTFSMVMDNDEIKEIVTDPNDRLINLYYRREDVDANNEGRTLYYADWSAFYADRLKTVH